MRLLVAGEIYVSIEYLTSGKVQHTKVGSKKIGETEVFMDNQAEASVEIGLTKNLGNYESLRVTVGVRLPCVSDELPATLDRGKNIVEAHLHRFVNEAMGDDKVKF